MTRSLVSRLIEGDVPENPESPAAPVPEPSDPGFLSFKSDLIASKNRNTWFGLPQDYSWSSENRNPFFRAERDYGQGGRTYIGGSPAKRIDNNTYAIKLSSPGNETKFAICLHQTNVVTVSPSKVVYDTGGWNTKTTMDRMSRYLVGGWRLYTYQSEFYWWNTSARCNPGNRGVALPFTDGDSIDIATGTLTAQATPVLKPKSRQRVKVSEGVYADLSGRSPSFYVTCKKCGTVDGNYRSQREAEQHQICGSCLFDMREKMRRDLEKDGIPKRRA